MDEIDKLTTSELQTLLKNRGLSHSYRLKTDLVKRLKEAIEAESVEKSKEQDSEEIQDSQSAVETVEEVKRSSESKDIACGAEVLGNLEMSLNDSKPGPSTNNFVFKDVEESLETFSGESGKSVTSWIKNFEDIATVCVWNDIQKYLYTRRLLRGAAKLSVEACNEICNWKDLREHLMREFSDAVSSVSIHRALENRRKERNETFLEYMYSMKAIASRGQVDEESLVTYIIAGIPDEVLNKTVLYEAKTLNDLKTKFKVYETIKNQLALKKNPKPEQKGEPRRGKLEQLSSRCKGCGSKSHTGDSCPHRSKGSRCFNCNQFGHIAPNCPEPKKSSQHSQTISKVNVISIAHDLQIKVTLNGKQYFALLDTGSDVTLARQAVKNTLQVDQGSEGPSILLSGFGQQIRRTLGSFSACATIGDEDYQVQFHVVPNSWLSQDLLIGKDVLKNLSLILERGKVSIRKGVQENKEDESDFLEKIDVVQLIEDTELPSISDITDKVFQDEVRNLVKSYEPVQPTKSCVEMVITLEDDKPVYQKPRRLAPLEKEIVSSQVKQWLDEGIIRHSNSDFASPVVLARKRDGSSRLCIDYRKLNKKIVKDRYPLPVIEELLENLYDARVFTTLDLKNGFFHVDVKEESRKYTSFITPDGQFEFLKAPFGLCNSPAVFQRFINTIFQPLLQKGILLVYIDDIIIPSGDERENLRKLKLTLDVAAAHGLLIRWTKCKFLQRNIEFLGHIVGNGDIKPSSEKILAVQKFPPPKNVRQIQSFLGLTGFFRKFIPNYSTTAKPLSDLLRNDAHFTFGPQQQDAFNLLKEMLCKEPVLKLFHPKLESEVHTDASKAGFGAVLLQRHPEDNQLHPVFYLSFKTNDAETRYSSYELEVLAIVKALRKLRPYLLGLEFKVFTDCKAFQLTMRKKELSSRVARWALLIEEFNCSVHHRSGSAMRHVDALSRYPAVYSIESEVLQQVKGAQEKDETCRLISEILKEREFEDYVLRGNILYKFKDGDYLLVVPKALQKEIIRTVHEPGHINGRKIEALVRQEYYIPNLSKKIESVLLNCVTCILASRKTGKQEGLLNPIEKIDVPLHTYHLDHLGPLPSTAKNYKYLFVVIDAFTKFSWIYPVKAPTADEVIKKLEFQSEVFGNPYRMITDRGTAFTANAFQSYCEQQKINHILITTGVPRGNGQIERLNQTIINVLSKISLDDPQKWYKHVPDLQRILNSTVSRATGKTPFELLIGTRMRRPGESNLAQILEEEIVSWFEESRAEMRQEAKRQIGKIQEENRSYSKRRRKPARIYKVHDLVAIKRTQFATGAKLLPKFLGPYEVVRVNGKDRYDVQKVGTHEGPNSTSSSADNMKPWSQMEYDSGSETEDIQDGRMWEQIQPSTANGPSMNGTQQLLPNS